MGSWSVQYLKIMIKWGKIHVDVKEMDSRCCKGARLSETRFHVTFSAVRAGAHDCCMHRLSANASNEIFVNASWLT